MASNLDYLDPALVPLEEKVAAYLTAEKALRRITDAGKTEELTTPAQVRSADELGQTSTQTLARPTADHSTSLDALRADLARLEQEIIAQLPTRDEWLKVNLGYGPSRVGAWHVPATSTAPERYELRIVH
ncbi:MAG: hypothetical protein JWR44_863 [Hymenobacter sp.]|jgi:hypothetical protein|nr:hypothetical protein [Hymenobacter sp.]